MKRFEIGDRIVALSSNSVPHTQPRVKGQIYTTLDVIYCCKCGAQLVNIVALPPVSPRFRCGCDNRQLNKGKRWSYSEFFAKMDDLQSEIDVAVEVEDYETAVLLRDLNSVTVATEEKNTTL